MQNSDFVDDNLFQGIFKDIDRVAKATRDNLMSRGVSPESDEWKTTLSGVEDYVREKRRNTLKQEAIAAGKPEEFANYRASAYMNGDNIMRFSEWEKNRRNAVVAEGADFLGRSYLSVEGFLAGIAGGTASKIAYLRDHDPATDAGPIDFAKAEAIKSGNVEIQGKRDRLKKYLAQAKKSGKDSLEYFGDVFRSDEEIDAANPLMQVDGGLAARLQSSASKGVKSYEVGQEWKNWAKSGIRMSPASMTQNPLVGLGAVGAMSLANPANPQDDRLVSDVLQDTSGVGGFIGTVAGTTLVSSPAMFFPPALAAFLPVGYQGGQERAMQNWRKKAERARAMGLPEPAKPTADELNTAGNVAAVSEVASEGIGNAFEMAILVGKGARSGNAINRGARSVAEHGADSTARLSRNALESLSSNAGSRGIIGALKSTGQIAKVGGVEALEEVANEVAVWEFVDGMQGEREISTLFRNAAEAGLVGFAAGAGTGIAVKAGQRIARRGEDKEIEAGKGPAMLTRVIEGISDKYALQRLNSMTVPAAGSKMVQHQLATYTGGGRTAIVVDGRHKDVTLTPEVKEEMSAAGIDVDAPIRQGNLFYYTSPALAPMVQKSIQSGDTFGITGNPNFVKENETVAGAAVIRDSTGQPVEVIPYGASANTEQVAMFAWLDASAQPGLTVDMVDESAQAARLADLISSQVDADRATLGLKPRKDTKPTQADVRTSVSNLKLAIAQQLREKMGDDPNVDVKVTLKPVARKYYSEGEKQIVDAGVPATVLDGYIDVTTVGADGKKSTERMAIPMDGAYHHQMSEDGVFLIRENGDAMTFRSAFVVAVHEGGHRMVQRSRGGAQWMNMLVNLDPAFALRSGAAYMRKIDGNMAGMTDAEIINDMIARYEAAQAVLGSKTSTSEQRAEATQQMREVERFAEEAGSETLSETSGLTLGLASQYDRTYRYADNMSTMKFATWVANVLVRNGFAGKHARAVLDMFSQRINKVREANVRMDAAYRKNARATYEKNLRAGMALQQQAQGEGAQTPAEAATSAPSASMRGTPSGRAAVAAVTPPREEERKGSTLTEMAAGMIPSVASAIPLLTQTMAQIVPTGGASVRAPQATREQVEQKGVEQRAAESTVEPDAAGIRGGRPAVRDITPLAGAPVVEGATGPDPNLVDVAEQYAAENGIVLRRQSYYARVDEDRARRIAQAYEEMPHAPNNPEVQDAYAELIRQTVAQYRALERAGYKFWFFDESTDPYEGKPWRAMRDLRANKSMAVYSTEAGFGTSPVDVSDNPLLADTGIEWSYGSPDGPKKRVLANDLFRAVHDAFGHGLEGAGFRADGEENAWQAHVRLFTGSAVAAMTSETRGQNSWLNYGPFGEFNRTAPVEETKFADQKSGLMPQWAWEEGRVPDAVFSARQISSVAEPGMELEARLNSPFDISFSQREPKKRKPIARGKKAMISRIQQEYSRRDMPIEDVQFATDLMERIGGVDQTAIRFLGDKLMKKETGTNARSAGLFSFVNDMIMVGTDAVKSGDFRKVFAHEYWHKLTQYLSDAEVEKANADFLKARERFTKKTGLNAEDYSRGGKPRAAFMAELGKQGIEHEEWYRLVNLDEWIAENMSDPTLERMELSEQSENILGFGRLLLRNALTSVKQVFGKGRYDAIARDFLEGGRTEYMPGLEPDIQARMRIPMIQQESRRAAAMQREAVREQAQAAAQAPIEAMFSMRVDPNAVRPAVSMSPFRSRLQEVQNELLESVQNGNAIEGVKGKAMTRDKWVEWMTSRGVPKAQLRWSLPWLFDNPIGIARGVVPEVNNGLDRLSPLQFAAELESSLYITATPMDMGVLYEGFRGEQFKVKTTNYRVVGMQWNFEDSMAEEPYIRSVYGDEIADSIFSQENRQIRSLARLKTDAKYKERHFDPILNVFSHYRVSNPLDAQTPGDIIVEEMQSKFHADVVDYGYKFDASVEPYKNRAEDFVVFAPESAWRNIDLRIQVIPATPVRMNLDHVGRSPFKIDTRQISDHYSMFRELKKEQYNRWTPVSDAELDAGFVGDTPSPFAIEEKINALQYAVESQSGTFRPDAPTNVTEKVNALNAAMNAARRAVDRSVQSMSEVLKTEGEQEVLQRINLSVPSLLTGTPARPVYEEQYNNPIMSIVLDEAMNVDMESVTPFNRNALRRICAYLAESSIRHARRVIGQNDRSNLTNEQFFKSILNAEVDPEFLTAVETIVAPSSSAEPAGNKQAVRDALTRLGPIGDAFQMRRYLDISKALETNYMEMLDRMLGYRDPVTNMTRLEASETEEFLRLFRMAIVERMSKDFIEDSKFVEMPIEGGKSFTALQYGIKRTRGALKEIHVASGSIRDIASGQQVEQPGLQKFAQQFAFDMEMLAEIAMNIQQGMLDRDFRLIDEATVNRAYQSRPMNSAGSSLRLEMQDQIYQTVRPRPVPLLSDLRDSDAKLTNDWIGPTLQAIAAEVAQYGGRSKALVGNRIVFTRPEETPRASQMPIMAAINVYGWVVEDEMLRNPIRDLIPSGDIEKLNSDREKGIVRQTKGMFRQSLEAFAKKWGGEVLYEEYGDLRGKRMQLVFDQKLVDSVQGQFPLFSMRRGAAGAWDRYMVNFIDRHQALRLYADQQRRRGALPDANNPYLGLRLLPGILSARVQRLNRQYRGILRQMFDAGVDLDMMDQFLTAQHARERNENIAARNPAMPDGGSGMMTADADMILNGHRASGTYDMLDRLAGQWRAMLNAALAERYTSGMMTTEDYQRLSRTYQNYVPLRGRPADPFEEDFEGGQAFGGGMSAQGVGMPRAYGRESRAENVTSQVAFVVEDTLRRAERNRVANRFLRMVLDINDVGFAEVIYPTTRMDIRGVTETVFDRNWSRDPRNFGLYADADMTINGRNYARGELVIVRLNNGNLQKSLGRSLDLSLLRSVMNTPNTLFREMTTGLLAPAWMLRNIGRDFSTGVLRNYANYGLRDATMAVARWPMAFGRVLVDEWINREPTGSYARYIDNGGSMAPYGPNDLEMQAEAFDRMYDEVRRIDPNERLTAQRVFSRNFILGAYRAAFTASETASRLATFNQRLAQGDSVENSVLAGRDVTVDFAKGGYYKPFFNTVWLYWNASMQGSANTLDAVRRSPGMGIALLGVGFFTALMNRMNAGDDDETEMNRWDQVSRMDKANKLYMFSPDKSGKAISVPQAYGFNIFTALGQDIADMTYGDRVRPQDVFLNLMDNSLNYLNAFGGSGVTQGLENMVSFAFPTVFRFMPELALNADFAGRAIYPENPYAPETAEAYQAFENTPEIYRQVAEMANRLGGGNEIDEPVEILDWSPDSLEYMIGFMFSGFGRELQRIYTTATGETKGSEAPVVRDFTYDAQNNERFVVGEFNDIKKQTQLEKYRASQMKQEAERFVPGAPQRELGELNVDAMDPGIRDGIDRVADISKQIRQSRKTNLSPEEVENLKNLRMDLMREVIRRRNQLTRER